MSSDLIEQRAMLADADQELPPPLPMRDFLEPERSILQQLLSAPPKVPPHQPQFFQPGPQATVTQDQYAPYPVPFNAFPQYNYPIFVDYQQQGSSQFPQFGYDFHTNYNSPYGFNGFPTQPIQHCPVENVKETRKRKATEDSIEHDLPGPEVSKRSLVFLALLNAENHSGSTSSILQFLKTNFYSFDGNSTVIKANLRSHLVKKNLFEKNKTENRDIVYRLIDPENRDIVYRLIDPENRDIVYRLIDPATAHIQKELNRKKITTRGMKFPEIFFSFDNTSPRGQVVSPASSNIVQSESISEHQEEFIKNESHDLDFVDPCFEEFGQQELEIVSVKSVEPESKKHRQEIITEKQSFDFDFVDPVFPDIGSSLVEVCENESELAKLCKEETRSFETEDKTDNDFLDDYEDKVVSF